MPDRKYVRPRIPLDLADRIEAAKDPLIPFERWVQRALEQALGEQATSGENPEAKGVRGASRASASAPVRASSPARPSSGAATAPSPSRPGESSRRFGCPLDGCSWKGTNVPGGACPTHQVEAVPA